LVISMELISREEGNRVESGKGVRDNNGRRISNRKTEFTRKADTTRFVLEGPTIRLWGSGTILGSELQERTPTS